MRVHLLVPASPSVLRSHRYAALEPALMPMALGYLGAVLREAGHQVTLRDQPALTWTNEQVLDEIGRLRPGLLGISALTGAWRNTVDLCREVRRRWPAMPIAMGNTHASVFAEQVLADGHADLVIRGEGELTLPELVAALEAGDDPAAVAGVSWRDGDTIHHNPDRPPIEDLDALPWPAWDLLDLSAWRYQRIPLVNLRTHPVPLMASRGCPYRCQFCSQDKAVRAFRTRRVGRVVEEVDHMVRNLGFRAFGFNDSYFPWDEETGLEFADRIRSHPWRDEVRWVTETRVDRVDDRLMGALRASGLHAIFYGFESGNDDVLKRVGKRTTVEQGREAVKVAHRHGVKVIGFFMVGLPGDTAATMEDTVRFALDTGVDIAKFAITIPYPGSALFDRLESDRITLEQCDQFTSWYDWTDPEADPLWATDGVDADQLVRVQRRAMLRFYGRPRYVWRALRDGLFTPREMALGGGLLLGRLTDQLRRPRR